jgi:hypothetical protein
MRMLLLFVTGIAGLAVGRATRPEVDAAPAVVQRAACVPVVVTHTEPEPAPEPEPEAAPSDDDDGGTEVADLLVVAQRRAEQLRLTRQAIVGQVSDAHSGAPLPGVTIVVSSPGGTVSAFTDGNGNFVVLDLAPASYTVTFYYLDLAVARDGVATSAIDTTRLDQQLDLDQNRELGVSFSGVTTFENEYIVDE